MTIHRLPTSPPVISVLEYHTNLLLSGKQIAFLPFFLCLLSTFLNLLSIISQLYAAIKKLWTECKELSTHFNSASVFMFIHPTIVKRYLLNSYSGQDSERRVGDKKSLEAAAQHREISSGLCDHIEGWDREGGRETQEGGDMGIYVCI